MKLQPSTMRLRHWWLALLALILWQASHAAHHLGAAQVPGKALGVTIRDVPFEALEAGSLDYGVRVVGVMSGSPAAAAGVEKDDIIVELNGKPAYSVKRLQWLVRQAAEGTPIPMKLQRQDKLETANVSFKSATPPTQVAKGRSVMSYPGVRRPSYAPGGYLGVQFQPMTPQLRAAFGAPTDRGVLVVAVVEDGPAAKAGLAAGDVIVRMDRKAITTMRELYRVLAYFDAGDEIEVEVIREQASQNLTARLGNVPMSMSRSPRYSHPHPHHRHRSAEDSRISTAYDAGEDAYISVSVTCSWERYPGEP